MNKQRAQKLIDIGSTTALTALVEIVESNTSGVLARQARAMLARLSKSDHIAALEGFCDELQSFVESVPGMKHPIPEKPERILRRAR